MFGFRIPIGNLLTNRLLTTLFVLKIHPITRNYWCDVGTAKLAVTDVFPLDVAACPTCNVAQDSALSFSASSTARSPLLETTNRLT